MIFLDTNLLARLILRDDPIQHQTALQFILQPRSYAVSSTVMLELVWVLSCKRVAREAIISAITDLVQLPNLYYQDRKAMLTALSGYRQGMDFADALHLALCRDAKGEAFATADRDLARDANKLGLQPPVELVRFPS
jgi:predicted nucleic acid-binding protein